jgi:hypothetical protein
MVEKGYGDYLTAPKLYSTSNEPQIQISDLSECVNKALINDDAECDQHPMSDTSIILSSSESSSCSKTNDDDSTIQVLVEDSATKNDSFVQEES